jgi:hypothetical protein
MHDDQAERAFTLVEVLAIVAIVALGTVCSVGLSLGNQGGRRTATIVQLVGLVDRAHATAAANGATLQFAPDPNGPGSVVLLYDGFSGGSTVATAQTATLVGASCAGPSCAPSVVLTTFALRVRRDGSYDLDAGSGLVGAARVTLGIAGAAGLTEGVTVDTTDLHLPYQERT